MSLGVTKFKFFFPVCEIVCIRAFSSLEVGSFISVGENNQLRAACVSEFSKL